MAYVGTIKQTATHYHPRYVVGIGDIPSRGKVVEVELEHYKCDKCEHDSRVLGKATENFYCGNCGKLVGIE